MGGSPPRVRGIVRSIVYGIAPIRITPACAGNRDAESGKLDEEKDHPRVCGE